jgi:Fe-Mn family superoxide dismutase
MRVPGLRQVWNHTFFWESMKPNGGGAPSGKLADAINASFGSLDEFKTQFKNAGGGPGVGCSAVRSSNRPQGL